LRSAGPASIDRAAQSFDFGSQLREASFALFALAPFVEIPPEPAQLVHDVFVAASVARRLGAAVTSVAAIASVIAPVAHVTPEVFDITTQTIDFLPKTVHTALTVARARLRSALARRVRIVPARLPAVAAANVFRAG
jgi:hypothetical protein